MANMDDLQGKTEATSEVAVDKPKCAVCDNVETEDRKLLLCGRCKKTRYCSKECQTSNWNTHKSLCQAQNYILKVDLEPDEITDPSVSRTLSCPANATFDQLHSALQTAFSWANTHTYDFKIKDPDAESEEEPDIMSYMTRRMAQDNAQWNNTPIPDSGPRQNFLRIIEKDPHRGRGFASGIGIDVMHNAHRVHSQTPEVDSKKIQLSKVFENKEYADAGLEYEYDFGDCWAHKITIVGRADATATFKCTDGEGHYVAEDAGSYSGWLKLREAYRTSTPTKEQREKRTWFENRASNSDRRGLGNGRDRVWDKDAINAKLQLGSAWGGGL